MNDKLDLTQAEAIADLINATSEQAAKSALQSLQGQFSKHIETLVEKVNGTDWTKTGTDRDHLYLSLSIKSDLCPISFGDNTQ